MDENNETKKVEFVKKRPMKRRVDRRRKEFKDKHGGVTYSATILMYKKTIYKRDRRIKDLLERVSTNKKNHTKKLHDIGVLHRRALRSKDTIINQWKKKYKDFQARKGIRHRTVNYKYKYVYYESPTIIKNFEKTCTTLKDNFSDSHLESFEKIVKVISFIEKYNEENNTSLTIEHYLLLLVTLYSKPILGGITSPKVVLPQMSQHKIRKGLNYLAEIGMLSKPSSIKFKINLLGEGFLKDIRNFDSHGKSEVVELVKKITGLFKYEDNGNINFENL